MLCNFFLARFQSTIRVDVQSKKKKERKEKRRRRRRNIVETCRSQERQSLNYIGLSQLSLMQLCFSAESATLTMLSKRSTARIPNILCNRMRDRNNNISNKKNNHNDILRPFPPPLSPPPLPCLLHEQLVVFTGDPSLQIGWFLFYSNLHPITLLQRLL